MGESGDFGRSPFFGQLSVKAICLTARQRTTPRAVTPGEFVGIFAAREAGSGPSRKPRLPAVASGRWGAPVAGVMWPTADGCDRLTHAIGYSIASSTRR
jgi:hypothetical protein